MEVRKVIRVSEILAVLLIGMYWLIFPNNFSEPLIVILGAVAVLFGELVNHSLKKKKKQVVLDSRAFTTIFLLVVVFACTGIYSFHFYSNNISGTGISPLIIIGSLLMSFFIFGVGFQKPIQRYFERPWGYLIEENNELKNIHPEKSIEIVYEQYVTNKYKGVTYKLDSSCILEPNEKKKFLDVDSYKATIKEVIKGVSFYVSKY